MKYLAELLVALEVEQRDVAKDKAEADKADADAGASARSGEG